MDIYIQKFGEPDADEKQMEKLKTNIPLQDETKNIVVDKTLRNLMYIGKTEDEQKEIDE